jgi:hypothetical protein
VSVAVYIARAAHRVAQLTAGDSKHTKSSPRRTCFFHLATSKAAVAEQDEGRPDMVTVDWRADDQVFHSVTVKISSVCERLAKVCVLPDNNNM